VGLARRSVAQAIHRPGQDRRVDARDVRELLAKLDAQP
jgi:hypothetical protein